jgi:membrane-bound lytic murein transglycosylase D
MISYEELIIQPLRDDIVLPLKTKTMLKSTITRAGLLSPHLLLIAMPYGKFEAKPVRVFQNLTTKTEIAYESKATVAAANTTAYKKATPAIELNAKAAAFIKGFLQRENEALADVQGRSASYFKIADAVFSKYGLPSELKYLAVVESDLKTQAQSHAGAAGPWQLMPETAKDYGLHITKNGDERKHFYKSTVAAAKYIRGLYNELGDWLLTIAAYNCGTGTIARAIKKAGSTNFWALQSYLPAETRGHVKRYIATQYYFEGTPGITCLTKAETENYQKKLADFNCESGQVALNQ